MVSYDSDSGDDFEVEFEPKPLWKKVSKPPIKRSKRATFDSDNESVVSKPPSAKKVKTVKKAVLVDRDANADDSESMPVVKINGKVNGKINDKGASEKYQKLTQLEHVIKRPDTYIGSAEVQSQEMWVFDSASEDMKYKKVNIVPGLYKIFDEILVNAADNKIRDPGMDTLKVDFDRTTNTISVWNNGHGIPVEIHEKEGIYIPDLIFGHLLTSSNYDDDQKKVTGGRNGYGAKLANIFSTEFTLETADKKSGKKYVQTWTDNMSKKTAPKITAHKSSEYTKITFKPDLAKFGMCEIDDDLESVFKRRVYDLAGCVQGIKVLLNGERIKVKNFKDYTNMYIATLPQSEKPPPLVYEKVSDRWEVAFTLSDGQFNQVSFVNSIATTKGGTHVEHIAHQIVTKIIEAYEKKNKKATKLKPFQVKSHMWLFVNCLIENPAFESQTKETMSTKPSGFGSKCPLSEDFIKKVLKSGILDDITRMSDMRADKAMKKTDGNKRARITGMAKLEDANKAGTKDADKCTLILTEGDSAKALAISGMSIVGRDHFGVYPLRGKLLNVREASAAQVTANAEIQAIKQILGLKHGVKYTSAKELRYGHLMIMTDQDHDGSHIKGLIINYLEVYYSSLLDIPGFLVEFITPIVRCTKGKEVKSFFTLPEYEFWKESSNPGKEWKIKYFKGLGTSTAADAKQYFSDLDKHLKEFHTKQEGDSALIELAFAKKKADDRKEWLRLFKPGTFMDHSMAKIPIADFINKELILFSMADNVRSIPSAIDGFKPGQRKVIFGCFKRKLKAEIKVAQLVGYVSEHTAYHHGEASLSMTIVALAQSYVGSNNINLLLPNGQFGTRHQGGKDAASPRYIFTDLAKITRRIFPDADSPLLNYLNDDGMMVEPEWYVPILPMVLVNGAEGIGTGWSTSIPNFNPKEIIDNLRRLMDGEETKQMQPWYRGFKGPIGNGEKEGNYRLYGIIKEIDDVTVEISELPIGLWTVNMKEFLEKAIAGDEKTPSWIKDYSDNSTESTVHFTITLLDKAMKDVLRVGLIEKFKLVENVSMKNLVAFDADGRIKRYASVEEILMEFYHVRLQYYQKRKDWMVADLERQYERLSNQARFVQMICKKELVVSNKKKAGLVNELKALKFTPYSNKKEAKDNGEIEASLEEDAVDDVKEDKADHGYDYLLGMAIWSLTQERVDKLLRDRETKEAELDQLLKLNAKNIWRTDLAAFEDEWEQMLDGDSVLASKATVVRKTAKGTKLAKGAKAASKKKRDADSDEEESGDDFSPAAKKRKTPVKKETVQSKLDFGKTKAEDDAPQLAKKEAKPKVRATAKAKEFAWPEVAKRETKAKIGETERRKRAVHVLSDSEGETGKRHVQGLPSDESMDIDRLIAGIVPKREASVTSVLRQIESDDDDFMSKLVKGSGDLQQTTIRGQPVVPKPKADKSATAATSAAVTATATLKADKSAVGPRKVTQTKRRLVVLDEDDDEIGIGAGGAGDDNDNDNNTVGDGSERRVRRAAVVRAKGRVAAAMILADDSAEEREESSFRGEPSSGQCSEEAESEDWESKHE